MIAREYQRAFRNLLDLVQEGNIGLMEAVKKFDPYRGVRFPSYAVWWVRAYIIRYIMNNWRMVKLGTTQAQRKLFFNLQKEKRPARSARASSPSPSCIAQRLDVKESEVDRDGAAPRSRDLSVDAAERRGERRDAARRPAEQRCRRRISRSPMPSSRARSATRSATSAKR